MPRGPVDEVGEKDFDVGCFLGRHQPVEGYQSCHLNAGPGRLKLRQRWGLAGRLVLVGVVDHRRRGVRPGVTRGWAHPDAYPGVIGASSISPGHCDRFAHGGQRG